MATAPAGQPRVSCDRRAPRSGRPCCLRRDRQPRRSSACVGHHAANRCLRNRSASQADGSSQSVIFSVRFPCSLSFRMGPSRKARSATAATMAASARSAGFAPLSVVQHGWSSIVIFEPHSRPFVGIAVRSAVCAWDGAARNRARTARTGRSIDALMVLVRRRPVVADAGIDDQRHRERGGAFHHLAGHVLGLVDLLVGHLEQQFVVHLQQHPALEPAPP